MWKNCWSQGRSRILGRLLTILHFQFMRSAERVILPMNPRSMRCDTCSIIGWQDPDVTSESGGHLSFRSGSIASRGPCGPGIGLWQGWCVSAPFPRGGPPVWEKALSYQTGNRSHRPPATNLGTWPIHLNRPAQFPNVQGNLPTARPHTPVSGAGHKPVLTGERVTVFPESATEACLSFVYPQLLQHRLYRGKKNSVCLNVWKSRDSNTSIEGKSLRTVLGLHSLSLYSRVRGGGLVFLPFCIDFGLGFISNFRVLGLCRLFCCIFSAAYIYIFLWSMHMHVHIYFEY